NRLAAGSWIWRSARWNAATPTRGKHASSRTADCPTCSRSPDLRNSHDQKEHITVARFHQPRFPHGRLPRRPTRRLARRLARRLGITSVLALCLTLSPALLSARAADLGPFDCLVEPSQLV